MKGTLKSKRESKTDRKRKRKSIDRTSAEGYLQKGLKAFKSNLSQMSPMIESKTWSIYSFIMTLNPFITNSFDRFQADCTWSYKN